MTDEQRNIIFNLRAAGVGYRRIAVALNLPLDTVKSHCKRHGMGGPLGVKGAQVHLCKNCGAIVQQIPKRKPRLFCSDRCRSRWWYKNNI